jgi:hypothetical protein
MFRCLLCDKKFKTERGLSVHLSRTHAIQGLHGRFSLKAVQEFFPLLRRRRWAKAEKFLELTVKKLGEDEWVKGYVHALSGMISALKMSDSSPRPYIVKLEDFGNKKLHEVKDMFTELSNTLDSKNTFDAAYFQAWEDFTQYALRTQD